MKKEFKKFSKLADKLGVKKNIKNIKNLKVDKKNIVKILKEFNQAIKPPEHIKRFYTHTFRIPHAYLVIALTLLIIEKSLASILFFIIFFSLIIYLTIRLPKFFKTVWGWKIFACFLIIPLVLNSFLFSTDLKTKEQAVNYLEGTAWEWTDFYPGGSTMNDVHRIEFSENLSTCTTTWRYGHLSFDNGGEWRRGLQTNSPMTSFIETFYEDQYGNTTNKKFFGWICRGSFSLQLRLKTNGVLEVDFGSKSLGRHWVKPSKM